MKNLKVFAPVLLMFLFATSLLVAQKTVDAVAYEVIKPCDGEKVTDGKEVEFKVWAVDGEGNKMMDSEDLGFNFFHTIGAAEADGDKMMENGLKTMCEGAVHKFTVKKEQLVDMPQEEKDQIAGDHVVYQMEVVSVADARPSGVKVLKETILNDGPEAASMKLAELQKEDYTLHQSQLNQLGYELLQKEKPVEAQVIFQINANLNPESSNAQDSLGDAFLAQGKTEEAKTCFEKAIELNPDNTYSKMKLEKLQQSDSTRE